MANFHTLEIDSLYDIVNPITRKLLCRISGDHAMARNWGVGVEAWLVVSRPIKFIVIPRTHPIKMNSSEFTLSTTLWKLPRTHPIKMRPSEIAAQVNGVKVNTNSGGRSKHEIGGYQPIGNRSFLSPPKSR